LSGKIVVLPADLTNKIAAGEVIERPASIVKELLENALDAGATDIVVELQRGGCESIRVIDNGEGLDPEDAVLAFSRYATSKIYQFDDIYQVHSFGFRGEALPSIASVSRVEMVTKRKGALAGVRIIVEAGEIKEISETGCREGTSIYVRDIFGPVPVRRKFLKSEPTEQGHCLDVVSRLALSHPALSLKVEANGREILNVPATGETGERLALVLGTDFLDQMVSLSGKRNGVALRGFASRPSLTRANARNIFPFVNKRFIRDHLVNHAVMTAYRNIIEAKRYPAVVLLLEVPSQDVDVNVHPAKMEVRFREPKAVYETIVEILTASLNGAPLGMPGEAATNYSVLRTPSAPRTFSPVNYRARVEEALKRYTIASPTPKTAFETTWSRRETGEMDSLALDPAERREEHPPVMNFSDLHYIGQFMESYLIFSAPYQLIIVDQHAAHERLIFENLKMKSLKSGNHCSSQRLLIPEVISLPPRDYSLLMDCLPILQECGFEIEPFGKDTVVVKSLPLLFYQGEAKRLINDFLADFAERESASFEDKKEKIFAFLACKGAVKANHKLTPVEVAALCKDLDAVPNVLSCPHGRPILISQTLADLEKMFKRR